MAETKTQTALSQKKPYERLTGSDGRIRAIRNNGVRKLTEVLSDVQKLDAKEVQELVQFLHPDEYLAAATEYARAVHTAAQKVKVTVPDFSKK